MSKNMLAVATLSFALLYNQAHANEVYKVVLESNYPPYALLDEKGASVGFDVDILNSISKNQGFTLEFITKNPDKVLSEFEEGDYHIAVSGLSEEEIGDNLASNPYAYGHDVIMTKENGLTFQYLEELKNVKVATQIDTSYAVDLTELFGEGNQNLVLKNTSFLAFRELARDNVQALLGARGTSEYFAKQLPDMKFAIHEIQDEGYEKYELYILISSQYPELRDKINIGLQKTIESGEYQKVYLEWFKREPEIPQ